MKEQSKPFKPYVTLTQAFDYDENNPETRTGSPLVDAVMEAFHTLRPFSKMKIGKYLGLSPDKISAALEVATGYGLKDLRELWVQNEISRLRAKRPGISTESLAREAGFANRSGLWKALHRDVRKKEYAEQKKEIERYRRMTPEQQRAEIEDFRRRQEAWMEEMRAKRNRSLS